MRLNSFPVIKDIVLIGGGHAHVNVLRSFGMFPVRGARLTLISPDVDTPYSGMLPGYVSGHYTYDETHIDLGSLARFAGARYFATRVTGIDPERRLIRCDDGRPPVAYDVASIDAGSTPVIADDVVFERRPITVKPVGSFLAAWQGLRQAVSEKPDTRIAIVGAGAGGVELLLSMQYALASQSGALPGRGPGRFVLVTRDDAILPTHNDKVRKAFIETLAERNVEVVTNFEVKRFGAAGLSDGSREIEIDEAVWVTGAQAPAWFMETGLALDDRGFVAVNEKLQSVSHANVFGAGDCVTMIASPRPKSGVFAVRQGPVLTRNLRATMLARPLTRYRPQAKFLSLISTGDRGAVASWGNWFAKGGWVWRWKDDIDRKFMKTFNELPVMEEMADQIVPTVADVPDQIAREAGAMRCKGCGAKVGRDVLQGVLARLARDDGAVDGSSPDHAGTGPIALAVGDDAAAFEVPAGEMLVQTVDQFPLPVDDPFVGGQIAANHCLGDIYAMGARPHSALAAVTLPFAASHKREDDLEQLMAGAGVVFAAAGCRIIGGHTGEGAETMLGFAVNGLARADQLQRKGGLKAGAALILTKPIGTGAVLAAAMQGRIRGRYRQAAIGIMKQSNRAASEILLRHGACGMTDVTGFGLAGHLSEMLEGAGLRASLEIGALPLIAGAVEAVKHGIVSSLQAENVKAAAGVVSDEAVRQSPAFRLIFDPQTAGGLLAGIDAERADAAIAALKAAGYDAAAIIGDVRDGEPAGQIVIG